MSERLLLATRSLGKLYELRPMFSAAAIEVMDLDGAGIPELPLEASIEEFDSFEENALAKARYFRAKSGLVTIADDSGLEVRALGDAPGVRTTRWSGRDDLEGRAPDVAHNDLLLRTPGRATDRRPPSGAVAGALPARAQAPVRGVPAGGCR